MDMSPACTMPSHQPSTEAEQQHPRFREYQSYVAQVRAQLVEAPPFSTWLRAKEEFENGRETVFRTQPGAMIADGWYKHIFLPCRRDPIRLGPFTTEAEAISAKRT